MPYTHKTNGNFSKLGRRSDLSKAFSRQNQMIWLLVALLLSATHVHAAVRMVAPVDGAWVTEQNLFLAGTTDDNTSHVAISGVKTTVATGKIAVVQGSFGTMIALEPGLNTITVKCDTDQISLKVFFTPATPAGKSSPEPPATFKRLYLHRDQKALVCKECHRIKNGAYDFGTPLPAPANCTAGKCHTEMGKAPHVHGPVGGGICIACHTPHGSFNPSELTRSGRSLCLGCHAEKKTEFEKTVVHAPVVDGCTDCHDPHQSQQRYQLRGNGKTVSSLCFSCHEESGFNQEHRHGPVAAGDCTTCHNPHASANKALLVAPAAKGELCFTCHDRDEGFTGKHLHAPVVQDCGQCHNPHSSPYPYQLRQEGAALCQRCHEKLNPEIYEAIRTAKVSHAPVDQGRCLDCHNIHSSNYLHLLKDRTEDLCFSCHVELGDYVHEAKNRHGPAKAGACTACHQVHGSQYAKLLVRYFPLTFYSVYKPDNYNLCFGCHNREIARKKFTDTLTNFRDGKYNLHYFHVNRPKSRTCTACHDPHASNQPKHIRYEIPFGKWSYPIEFTKRPSGGTCVVGCHAPKTYDRANPQVIPSR